MAAASASVLSSPPTVGADLAAAGAGRGAGALAGLGAATGAAVAREAGGGESGAGEAAGVAAIAGDAAPVGPPGGSVGNLIVGAAVGFGGSVMRTVSFFGWTLPVSFFGGKAPPGALGIFSAISFKRF